MVSALTPTPHGATCTYTCDGPQAARLVSSIARELAAQQGRAEALGYDLAGPVPASPPSAPAPDAYYSSSTEDRTDPMYWLE